MGPQATNYTVTNILLVIVIFISLLNFDEILVRYLYIKLLCVSRSFGNVHRLKLLPHESDNLDERIVMISCKRVHGATQARPCETSGCSRQRCAVK